MVITPIGPNQFSYTGSLDRHGLPVGCSSPVSLFNTGFGLVSGVGEGHAGQRGLDAVLNGQLGFYKV